jgi:hypothetical protein
LILVWEGFVVTEITVKAPNITPEEYKKYRGKDVAIYNNRVIAAGANSAEVLQKALKKYPNLKPEQIEIDYIQIADKLIL